MKVFITKYALTIGIMEMEVDQNPDHPQTVTERRMSGELSWSFHGEGREWHKTRMDAEGRALSMREAKIRQLKARIDRLEKMDYTPASEPTKK